MDANSAILERRWFGQQAHRVRLEWGRRGAQGADERGDVLVVVDVLSFSTAAATAVARGVAVYPCGKTDDPPAFAARVSGVLAVARPDVPAKGRYSLSPLTFLDAPAGERIVIASPNGATCSRYGRDVPRLYVAALVNARAVALAAARTCRTTGVGLTVLACGERWPTPNEDGELRFALEDLLGAGALLSHLPSAFSRSPEARAAETAFRAATRDGLEATLMACGSGIELVEKGYEGDVRHAARLNAYEVAPVLRDGERLEAE